MPRTPICRRYQVTFWHTGRNAVTERFTSKRKAAEAINEHVRDCLASLSRLRPALVRCGSAHRDGAVTVKHKAGGREFGAYITDLYGED